METQRVQTLDDLPLRPTRSHFRWYICLLLFFSTTINYVDRQLFANLIPYFEDELRIGPMDLAYINVAFLLSYGLGMMWVGRFVDFVGTRAGLAITFLIWNLAAAGHGLVQSVMGFILIRILLGLGEAGNFPSAIKTVAEWFPKRERALATGWFNCGSNIGAVITPPLVAFMAVRYGWRACFATLGSAGAIWLIFWIWHYRKPELHPRVSDEELSIIQSDPPETVGRVPVLTLLGQRQVYAPAMARFFTEAPWWFYLTWMPKFLVDKFGLSPYTMATAVAVIYLVADFGSVGGGWISSRLMKSGRSVNYARKMSLLIAALCTVPIISVAWMDGGTIFGVSQVWIVVPLVALAAAAHQAWSSNVYTVVSDMLPRSAVATSVGIGMAFGAIGSSAFQFLIAMWLVKTGSYSLPFILAGSLYLVGLGALHLISPRLEPAKIDDDTKARVTVWQVIAGLAAVAAILTTLQIQLNKPPYASRDDYVAKRADQLHAGIRVDGATAKIGWQDAQWIYWRQTDGTVKAELIYFDRDGRPRIEAKGAGVKKYVGPSADEVAVQRTLATTATRPTTLP